MFYSGNTQRNTVLYSFWKWDPAGSKGNQKNVAWVYIPISSPRCKGKGLVNTHLPCKQQQYCLWGCRPGFPYYHPSHHLQLCPDRMPVGHRLVIKNVLFVTVNVSLSAETKDPWLHRGKTTLTCSGGSRLLCQFIIVTPWPLGGDWQCSLGTCIWWEQTRHY